MRTVDIVVTETVAFAELTLAGGTYVTVKGEPASVRKVLDEGLDISPDLAHNETYQVERVEFVPFLKSLITMTKRRAQAMANWEFASDRLNITRDEYQLRSDEWHALDVLVSAPDATLLAIAEAIR